MDDNMNFKTKKIILLLIAIIVLIPFHFYRGNALMVLLLIISYFFFLDDFEFKDEKELINEEFNLNSIIHYITRDKIRLIFIVSIITCALPLIYNKIPIFPEFYYAVLLGIYLYKVFPEAD